MIIDQMHILDSIIDIIANNEIAVKHSITSDQGMCMWVNGVQKQLLLLISINVCMKKKRAWLGFSIIFNKGHISQPSISVWDYFKSLEYQSSIIEIIQNFKTALLQGFEILSYILSFLINRKKSSLGFKLNAKHYG